MLDHRGVVVAARREAVREEKRQAHAIDAEPDALFTKPCGLAAIDRFLPVHLGLPCNATREHACSAASARHRSQAY